jgi:AGCS family alanine or glycine:cation symporter
VEQALQVIVNYAWGMPLLALLVVGGFLLTLYSRFLPFRGGAHAFKIIRGDYDKADDPGQISHFQALATALSSTIGLGNIGGVAIAITQGGPGAVFWMWVAAIVGMATKFFTCTLAVMYRGKDSNGEVQGGPMYYIEVGLGRRYRALAILFSIFGMIGCIAMFQTNQMAEILGATLELDPWLQSVVGINVSEELGINVVHWLVGLVSVTLVAVVILGGLERIAAVASRLVPTMCLLYLLLSLIIIVASWDQIPAIFAQIFHDAFHGTAVAGGAAGIAWRTVIQTGIKRAAFSNEAGLGTAPMAHGAAKTTEPVREGLVAMVGPFIDTIIVCTLTAIVVLAAGNWQGVDVSGAALTASAFESVLGLTGKLALVVIVMLFGITTMFGYSYYGKKCFSYLFGAHRARIYDYIYLFMLFMGAIWKPEMVVNIIDTSFAMMTLPNMIATLVLAPKVMKATREYFSRQRL